jgi:pyruvate dehydrogenase complex dehydrogenase (E1) component
MACRQRLSGPLPARTVRGRTIVLPDEGPYRELLVGTGDTVATSTTSAFTRLLRNLLWDGDIGRRVVPIIPDEARTLGARRCQAKAAALRRLQPGVGRDRSQLPRLRPGLPL